VGREFRQSRVSGIEEGQGMRLPRRRFLHLAAGAAALPAASRAAWAQNYPSRPITMIVPFPAGGATDTLGRILADHMRGVLGQPIVIENVAGAAGSIGVGRAARSPGDGYTLSIGTSTTHVLIGALYALPFDLLTDLEPVAQLASEPLLIAAKKTMPANDLKELIAWLKANPDKASAGIAGVGATGHVTGIFFQKQTGTRYAFVPYRGNAPAIQDLLAGQIDMMIEPSSNFLPHVRAGTIKAYAMTSRARRGGARHPDGGRGGIARLSRLTLVRTLGAEGHAEGCHRQAQRGGGGCAGGGAGAPAACRVRGGNSAARAADAGGARRLPTGRDREMVADHQGGQHQAGVIWNHTGRKAMNCLPRMRSASARRCTRRQRRASIR
jgi:tripartite-type tricarboxylate transporter receptor subunit TctC